MDILPNELQKIITDYIMYEIIIFDYWKDGYPSVDNVMDCTIGCIGEMSNSNHISLLIYLDEFDNNYWLDYYPSQSDIYKDGISHVNFRKVNNTYYETRSSKGFALVNFNKKYLIVKKHGGYIPPKYSIYRAIDYYCKICPDDLIKVYTSIFKDVNCCGEEFLETTYEFNKFSSPNPFIDFIKKYNPKYYYIKTIKWDERVVILQGSQGSLTIINGNKKQQFRLTT